MSTIGLMEGAFFVGRKEIMEWINNTLDLNLSKVEDTASGAVACQLLDIMYPGQVPMHKVNWSAKQSFEFVANYKILQSCFSKLSIDRHIDVDRLISGRYMDNLEFMQWFKRFFELGVGEVSDYDAYAQRCKGKGGAQYGGGKRSGKPNSAPTKTIKSTVGSASTGAISAKSAAQKPLPAVSANQENSKPKNSMVNKDDEVAMLKAANEEAEKNYAELRSEMEGIEKERDFYFEKLRDIEITLQEVEDRGQGTELTAALFKILYATADGFEQANIDANPKTIDVEPLASTSNGESAVASF